MTHPADALSAALENRRVGPGIAAGAALLAAALALAGCEGLGNLASSETDDALAANTQPNLASLTEVIQKHPEDPQAYNMRGSVLAETGHTELALADFNKAIGL